MITTLFNKWIVKQTMNDLIRGVSVKAKLTISFLIVALLGALIGGIGIYSLSQANATAESCVMYL